MRNLRLIGFAVTSVVLVTSAQAQHLGARQQWQPQTESDPRLQQPAQLEIIGRATITGLPILSEKTGVSLGVAPEDLDTVGERKFTVIAHGCTLKAVMVQLCEALQECHWDVEAEGKEPVYLLHRNAGVEEAAQAAVDAAAVARQGEWRGLRAERVEAVRRALAMSPEELKKLEQSDLFLARGVRQPRMRAALEGLVSLSEEQIRTFLSEGIVAVRYGEATPQLQHPTVLALESMIREAVEGGAGDGQSGPTQAEVAGWRKLLGRELPADTSIRFRANSRGEIIMSVRAPAQPDAPEWSGGAYAVLSRYPVFASSSIAKWLLTDTGDTEAEAADLVRAWWKRGKEEREAEQARRSHVERGSLPPQLRRMIPIETHDMMSLTELQQKIAAATGLSLFSDHFWDDRFSPEPGALQNQAPLHEALDQLAPIAGFVWDVAGECLTFHRTQWYDLAQREAPESLINTYRDKLAKQGRFTLEDAAAFSTQLQKLRPEPTGRGPFISLPQDLEAAGLGDLAHPRNSWCVPLLASLTPEQRARAEREGGLAFSEMSRAQQETVLRVARNRFGEGGEARGRKACLHIRKHDSIADGHNCANYQIELDLPGDPSDTCTAGVGLRGAEAPPEALPRSE